MTFYSDVWRLPGPGGFVREIARLAAGGQHVLAVLPRFIANHSEYSDALTAAVLGEFDDSRRVYPLEQDGSLASALGFCMTNDFDDAPTTVPELLAHRDVLGRTFVCNAADLEHAHREDLPGFLRRVNDESRAIEKSDRPTFVIILGRDLLPADPGSVAMARVWYWDRVARWDVAAVLARQGSASGQTGLLDEVRLETIIEIARWDFQLAIEIARDWSGSQPELAEILSGKTLSEPIDRPLRRTAIKQPPESHFEQWDDGHMEAWHGVPGIKPATTALVQNNLDRLLWSAQARALMPWLEIRRVRVETIVLEKLGRQRMDSAIDQFSTRFPGTEFDASLVELATLSRIISALFGHTESRLRDTSRLLLRARNQLAHLNPLAGDELEKLVRDCAWLD